MPNGKGSALKTHSLPRFALLMPFPPHSKGYSINTLHYCSLLVKLDFALDYLACTLWGIIILNSDGRCFHGEVLIGLSRSCAIARNFNDARMYYGDVLKLGHLSQDAQVLLDLLTDTIPEDCSIVPKNPYFFPNTVWDSSQAPWKKEVA